ncbi:MAG: class I SAM-dependent methyltransferase [Bacteroidetes bacterium]|nr:class I SAM-dependent methyltransferase [Bacteroidota bacterium]
MNKLNKDWLICPVTKEKLIEKDGDLISSKYRYSNSGGFWNFIPSSLEELNAPIWKVWNQLQDNGVSSYKHSPTNNLGVGPRKDFMQFAEFCNFTGMVLDVGVGPQKAPTHIEFNTKAGVTFVGLDPLAGEQPRDFTFVQGLGEYLPFKDQLFDQVLFVTSLDHFIDPVIALQEAKRVVKNNGSVCVWLGEKDKNAPRPSVSPEWYKALQIPEGAEDPFHYRRFSVDDFKTFLPNAGLKISEEKIHIVDEWRKNCFYRLVK